MITEKEKKLDRSLTLMKLISNYVSNFAIYL